MANFTPEFLQDFPRHARAQDKEVLCQSLLVDSEAGTARLVLHRHHELQGGLNIRYQGCAALHDRRRSVVFSYDLQIHIPPPSVCISSPPAVRDSIRQTAQTADLTIIMPYFRVKVKGNTVP